MRRQPTIKEVARQAGAPVATVSRSMIPSGPVNVQTRTVIDKVITESGLRPDSIARQLKTARTQTISVRVASLNNLIFSDAANGIESAAKPGNYNALPASTGYSVQRARSAVETSLRCHVDGLVLTVADEEKNRQ